MVESAGAMAASPKGHSVLPAIAPALSTMAKFRPEYEYYLRHKGSWKRAGATFEEALRAAEPAEAAP